MIAMDVLGLSVNSFLKEGEIDLPRFGLQYSINLPNPKVIVNVKN